MTPPFTMQITAQPGDIDELGHVSNLVYVRWVLDVAMAHSRARGWDWADYKAHGAVFVVRRHELDYAAPVLLGQALDVTTWVDSWKLASCVRKTEIVRDGQVVAKCATTWAMISLASNRPTKIDDGLLAAFTRAPA